MKKGKVVLAKRPLVVAIWKMRSKIIVNDLGYETVDLGPEDSSKSISYAEQGHKLANYLLRLIKMSHLGSAYVVLV